MLLRTAATVRHFPLFVVAAGALLSACGGTATVGQPPSSCVPGWWARADLQLKDCLAGCGGSTGGSLPECLDVDCAEWTVTAYLAPMTYYTGVILYSQKANSGSGTASTEGSFTPGTYTLTGDQLAVSPGFAPHTVTYCDQSQYIADGVTYNRLPSAMSGTFQRNVLNGKTSLRGTPLM